MGNLFFKESVGERPLPFGASNSYYRKPTMGGTNACLKLLPSILFVLWQNTFIVIGVYAMLEDRTLKDKPCGQQYHIWKFTLMNIVFGNASAEEVVMTSDEKKELHDFILV